MLLQRLQPILIAGLLPLLIFTWFAKDVAGQVDFWIMWLIAMTLVGLPIIFAEIALAQRSRSVPLDGLAFLTREADVASVWRGFGGLSIFLLVLIIGHLLSSSADILHSFLASLATPALLAILMLIVIAMSFFKHLAGWVALALAVVSLLLNISQTGFTTWQMTQSSLSEWSIAVLLSLVCVGAGTGLFWHTHTKQMLQEDKAEKVATSRYVLPIWGFQLFIGAMVAMTLNQQNPTNIVYSLAMLAGSAYLLNIVTEQISLKFSKNHFSFLVVVVLAVVCFGVALLPTTLLNMGLMFISFITAIWLAIFAGWQMKISHLRKSLNFSSEIIYNIWRIAVRIVVPLSVICAIIGIVMGMIR